MRPAFRRSPQQTREKSMKIAMFAGIVAVFAAVAPAQAALTVDGAGRPTVLNPDGSFQVAGWFNPRPPRQPAACACVRG
jgi:hypothetical protein